MPRFLPLAALWLCTVVQAQLTTWLNHVPQLEVRDIASNSTSVWLATQGDRSIAPDGALWIAAG